MVSAGRLPRILLDMSTTIGFLGAGHMGRAVLEGGIRGGMLEPEHVLVAEQDDARRAAASELGCRVASDAESLADASTIVLCVRPQDFAPAAETIRHNKPRLLVSVMAGIESDTIARACGSGSRVVRAMPNAPAGIGQGMTAVAGGAGAGDNDIAWAMTLFHGVGQVCQVPESAMWAVTAVSGSGPAWFYLLSEAILEEASALGLDTETAESLLAGTMTGAAAMLAESGATPAALREAVTTPGGTTEAGLAAMRSAGLVEAARAGVRAAYQRGEELAR